VAPVIHQLPVVQAALVGMSKPARFEEQYEASDIQLKPHIYSLKFFRPLILSSGIFSVSIPPIDQ
jgi:hypothetical protein